MPQKPTKTYHMRMHAQLWHRQCNIKRFAKFVLHSIRDLPTCLCNFGMRILSEIALVHFFYYSSFHFGSFLASYPRYDLYSHIFKEQLFYNQKDLVWTADNRCELRKRTEDVSITSSSKQLPTTFLFLCKYFVLSLFPHQILEITVLDSLLFICIKLVTYS